MIFGASGWWASNAITAEFPVFVKAVPEGNRFPNLVNVAFQVGNVFPFLYKAVTGWCMYSWSGLDFSRVSRCYAAAHTSHDMLFVVTMFVAC